ncbi:MAG: hypothetical protein II969_15820 [Anaerolineaceae bacterium]|nr:hypothetical protein [Anaerolineaceae bacterium]
MPHSRYGSAHVAGSDVPPVLLVYIIAADQLTPLRHIRPGLCVLIAGDTLWCTQEAAKDPAP